MNNTFRISTCYKYGKRIFDIVFSLILILLLGIPFIFLALIIKPFLKGNFLHCSNRIGKDGVLFKMIKLRTMSEIAPVVPFESIKKPEKYFLRFGRFLRNTGIDELPQLYNILRGEMSFVGPRPLLKSDSEVIRLRELYFVSALTPGLTGLAQVNGRNELSPEEKVCFDKNYSEKITFVNDIKLILKTVYFIFKNYGYQNSTGIIKGKIVTEAEFQQH